MAGDDTRVNPAEHSHALIAAYRVVINTYSPTPARTRIRRVLNPGSLDPELSDPQSTGSLLNILSALFCEFLSMSYD